MSDKACPIVQPSDLKYPKFDEQGNINCGACKHYWFEQNLEDTSEGCNLSRDEFSLAEPGDDCSSFETADPSSCVTCPKCGKHKMMSLSTPFEFKSKVVGDVSVPLVDGDRKMVCSNREECDSTYYGFSVKSNSALRNLEKAAIASLPLDQFCSKKEAMRILDLKGSAGHQRLMNAGNLIMHYKLKDGTLLYVTKSVLQYLETKDGRYFIGKEEA
jgi:ssDNA-binding Zn-finger/Zn-ribbon topoisomerase 1